MGWIFGRMYVGWIVLLDHPFCRRLNSRGEHKREHGPHGDDDQRFSLNSSSSSSSKGGGERRPTEGEKDEQRRKVNLEAVA